MRSRVITDMQAVAADHVEDTGWRARHLVSVLVAALLSVCCVPATACSLDCVALTTAIRSRL